jgi:AcrR family transcriptional regulator
VGKIPLDQIDETGTPGGDKRLRADAQRNLDKLLKTALEVFSTSGVDAPMREIAAKAGVGTGTIYRHFPQRSDLITAVFRREIDACADAAPTLAAQHKPFEALAAWIQRYIDFVAAKRGLAAALHSGDGAYCALPSYFDLRLRPALQGLLDAAVAAGEIRSGAKPNDLLRAIASLCQPAHDIGPDHAHNMIGLLLDGLRYGATKPAEPASRVGQSRKRSPGIVSGN